MNPRKKKVPTEKMEYHSYIDLLSKSTFILCPAGNNPETFRLYEALEVVVYIALHPGSDPVSSNEICSKQSVWNDWAVYSI